MQSLAYVKASDGSANASLMTIQSIRAPGATAISVNTVAGVPNKFYGTMGTPHTFTDPVTGETITVISDATAVDFAGHVDSGNIEIDAISPGYTDLGSEVGDIIILRPQTEYANNLYNVLNQSLDDDGTFKDNSVSSADMFSDPVDPVLRGSEVIYDHVASGGVITGDSYGSNRNASMTALVAYINGVRGTVAAVTGRTYTASKDTYVDILNTAGTFSLVYTEVANNAASPALAANSIRLGIVVTGASNIANVGSINQGQEDKVLPIVSSIPYTVTDSLGNLICPRDPVRRILGYRQKITGQSSIGNTPVDIVGLSVPVIVPVGRKIKITAGPGIFSNGTAGGVAVMFIMEGVTQLMENDTYIGNTANGFGVMAETPLMSPSTGLHTYKIQALATTGSATLNASTSRPTFIRVELC